MKIIVAYASAGRGHQKAAEVIYYDLRSRYPQHTVVLADSLDFSLPLFKHFYLCSYDFLVKHLSWLWAVLFTLTSAPWLAGCSRLLHSCCNRLSTGKFSRWLRAEQPDAVISTHFLVSDVVSRLKAQGKLRCRLYTVITDFGVHPFWLAAATDRYCVASAYTRDLLLDMGVAGETIRVTGIPVDAIFRAKFDRRELRRRYAIPDTAAVVLLVTGSFGIGPLEKIAAVLHTDCDVVVVCARNIKLLKNLQARRLARVHVYGFVNTMPELMALSDLIVTKPGGLSVSELLVMGVPPLFIAAIPGQETGNVRALEQRGIGVLLHNAVEVRRAVDALLRDPGSLSAQKARMAELARPQAVEEIVDDVCASGTRVTG